MISIIILAGGIGSRFGAKIPKQFVTINGKKIIDITIDKFLELKDRYDIEVIVVCHPSRFEAYSERPDIKCVEGADTRFNSFMKGYKAISNTTTRVLVHDAVRPLVSTNIISDVINELRYVDATTPYIKPTSSTIINQCNEITNINRDHINMTQTPEGFTVSSFNYLYNPNDSKNSDRTSIYSMYVDNQQIVNISLVNGSQDNIKITTRDDLELATYLTNKPQYHLPIRTIDRISGNVLLLGGTGGIGSEVHKGLLTLGVNVDVTDSSLHLENPDALLPFEDKEYTAIIHCVGTLSYKGETIIKDFSDTTYDEFKYCNDLMLGSAYHTAKLATKTIKKGGHLLFVGSSISYKGRDKFGLYAPPKAGLNAFVDSISDELYDKYEIKTNIINPSATNTSMVEYLPNKGKNKDLLEASTVAGVIIHFLFCNVIGVNYTVRYL